SRMRNRGLFLFLLEGAVEPPLMSRGRPDTPQTAGQGRQRRGRPAVNATAAGPKIGLPALNTASRVCYNVLRDGKKSAGRTQTRASERGNTRDAFLDCKIYCLGAAANTLLCTGWSPHRRARERAAQGRRADRAQPYQRRRSAYGRFRSAPRQLL